MLTPWKRWLTTLPRTDQKHSIIILHKLSAVLVPNAADRQYITHKLSIVMLIWSQVMQISPKSEARALLLLNISLLQTKKEK